MQLRIFFYLFFLGAFSVVSFSQTSSDEKLAEQFFQNKEFDKAVVYYEKLYSRQGEPFYPAYLSCLLELKDFKIAEKTVRRQMKQSPSHLAYAVDLGKIYELEGESAKSKAEYEKAIKQLGPEQEGIFSLAEAFIKLKEWDYAITVYRRGAKLLNGSYPFNMELADVYQQKGDLQGMINEYLDVLELGESYLQSVQNSLQASFGANGDFKKNELIKSLLIKRVQQEPGKETFSELLIWMYMQQREFEQAFVQLKALDRRKKEDGQRIMALAQTCVLNGDYDVAEKAYKYVLEKGPDGYYYTSAKMELLSAQFKKTVARNDQIKAELTDLETNFKKTIAELGKSAATVSLLEDLAKLEAFYLHNTNEAVGLLEEAIRLPQLAAQKQAECKLELGDIYLMTGDVWEASLTYSQVEKAFKYDQVGQEAKFRNARISFYTGDFKWAQAQLDVLKGSTSKLIANDAMALSILITDNVGWDSVTTPMEMYARADLLSFQNKDNEALAVLDSIKEKFPNHPIADDVLFKRYEIMMKLNKYGDAALFLQSILENYSQDILADKALFYLADLYENRLGDKQKAMGLYQDLLVKFPGSMFTVEARKRFRSLRGDAVN